MSLKHWSKLPMATDMRPYAEFYQEITKRVMNEAAAPVVVEAGVRYGCSARIFAETLSACRDWSLHLIDPVRTREALEVPNTFRNNCRFYTGKAEAFAQRFPDACIDLLHIDADVKGDHPYEMALQILLSFWYKLKPNGTIILHDCTPHFPTITKLANELVASGQWEAEYAVPQEECPISAPCVLRRIRPEKDIDGITMVVPIIKDEFLESLLRNVSDNSVRPDEIIVIDNSPDHVGMEICSRFPDLNIVYLPQAENLGVNASWNLGLKKARCEHVCILNDDLILPNGFFDGIYRILREVHGAGLVVPFTENLQKRVASIPGAPSLWHLPQRQGWAFTVKKNAVSQIPSNLFTFCGDDFFYYEILNNGLWCIGDASQRIFHYVGISQDLVEREQLGLPEFKDERAWWNAHREEFFCEQLQ